MTDESYDRFSLVVGGPFHTALRKLGLTGADRLPTRRAALILALTAWLLPGLLVLAQSLAGGASDLAYFTDATVYARYLIGVWVLVATEHYAEGRFTLLLRHFREARILRPDSLPAFTSALSIADRRSSSAVAEGVILVATLVWSSLVGNYVVATAGMSWEGSLVGGEVVLSWAGEAARFVSNPLFMFLVVRWFWRFFVWTALLFRISRLPLQLTPLHPDRAAGLGFMSIYPSIFSGFVFALSCVIASSILKELGLVQHNAQSVWFALSGWMGINLVLMLGPLFVFVLPLYQMRERAVLEYGRLASQHHLAFHRKWFEDGRDSEELLGSTDPSSTADLNASVEAVRNIRLVPIDRSAVIQLVLAAGVPLLAVVTSRIPLMELLKWLAGRIL